MISNFLSAALGGDATRIPQRVQDDVWRQQDRSEQIISLVQLAIVVILALYSSSRRGRPKVK
jgi:hypothetical protein